MMQATHLISKQIKSALTMLVSIFSISNAAIATEPFVHSEYQSESPLLLAALIEDEKRPQRISLDEIQSEKDKSSWAFYIDNDLFATGGRDRDYTGGFSFTLSGANASVHKFSIDGALSAINRWIDIDETSDATLHSFEFGLTAFTPENTKANQALFDDRPYASLVYVSNTHQQVDYKNKSSVISSLTLGVLGLNVAGNFQNAIHKLSDSDQAQGWDNQISDGGEFTFRYNLAHQKVRWANYTQPKFNYEIKTASNLSVGYLTDVSWSLSGRFGKIRSPWSSFNPQNVAYAEKNLPLAKLNNRSKKEFYLWAGTSIHARAYNALLQGQFKESTVTYSSDGLRHLIGEAWIGITSELDSGIRLSYFIRGQTSEIKTGPGSRNPIWGGFIISRSI